ncbi:MAG: DUF952 domain-containing protein [Bacteroidetes bacterium]|nr:DUF952 domain-containing protein [Bacteroidota bacterium]
MEIIYHITTRKVWDKYSKKRSYRADSLDSEGFIHCSPKDRVRSSAIKFFRGEKKILVLFIDSKKVKSEIIWEDSAGDNFLFPHIYGELNIDAVVEMFEIICNEDGLFIFPEGF